MSRLFSLLIISLFTFVICTRTSSMPTSDEETLKNLEMEAGKHSGTARYQHRSPRARL